MLLGKRKNKSEENVITYVGWSEEKDCLQRVTRPIAPSRKIRGFERGGTAANSFIRIGPEPDSLSTTISHAGSKTMVRRAKFRLEIGSAITERCWKIGVLWI